MAAASVPLGKRVNGATWWAQLSEALLHDGCPLRAVQTLGAFLNFLPKMHHVWPGALWPDSMHRLRPGRLPALHGAPLVAWQGLAAVAGAMSRSCIARA